MVFPCYSFRVLAACYCVQCNNGRRKVDHLTNPCMKKWETKDENVEEGIRHLIVLFFGLWHGRLLHLVHFEEGLSGWAYWTLICFLDARSTRQYATSLCRSADRDRD